MQTHVQQSLIHFVLTHGLKQWPGADDVILLTHLPQDKMTAILADNTFNRIFLNENDGILIQISPKYVPKSPIGNKLRLGSGNGLEPNRRQAITLINDDPIHWHKYAVLGEIS